LAWRADCRSTLTGAGLWHAPGDAAIEDSTSGDQHKPGRAVTAVRPNSWAGILLNNSATASLPGADREAIVER
jgi:hypothetical protein